MVCYLLSFSPVGFLSYSYHFFSVVHCFRHSQAGGLMREGSKNELDGIQGLPL